MAVRRCDPPAPVEVVSHWRQRGGLDIPSFPACWVCRRWATGGWGEAVSDGFLQRAHLIAHCFRGEFAVHNLVLLCPRCHREFDRVLQDDKDAALYRLTLLTEELAGRMGGDPGPITKDVPRGEPPGIPATGNFNRRNE